MEEREWPEVTAAWSWPSDRPMKLPRHHQIFPIKSVGHAKCARWLSVVPPVTASLWSAQHAGPLLPTVQLRALGTMLHERGATRPLHLDVERS